MNWRRKEKRGETICSTLDSLILFSFWYFNRRAVADDRWWFMEVRFEDAIPSFRCCFGSFFSLQRWFFLFLIKIFICYSWVFSYHIKQSVVSFFHVTFEGNRSLLCLRFYIQDLSDTSCQIFQASVNKLSGRGCYTSPKQIMLYSFSRSCKLIKFKHSSLRMYCDTFDFLAYFVYFLRMFRFDDVKTVAQQVTIHSGSLCKMLRKMKSFQLLTCLSR